MRRIANWMCDDGVVKIRAIYREVDNRTITYDDTAWLGKSRRDLRRGVIRGLPAPTWSPL